MKILKKLALVLAVAMLASVSAIAFSGCGESSDTSAAESSESAADSDAESSDAESGDASTASLSGTYAPSTITLADGTEQSYDEYVAGQAVAQGYEEGTDEYNAIITGATASYTFAEGGALTGTSAGVEFTGSYTYDGDSTVVITMGEQDFTYTYDSSANTLSMTDASTGIITTMSAQ